MRKLVALVTAGAVAALAAAALSFGAGNKTVWTAALSSGQEIPKQVVKDAAAHGQFKGTLSGTKLTWPPNRPVLIAIHSGLPVSWSR